MTKLKPYILIFPLLFIFISIFLFGILNALAQSFGYFPQLNLNSFTLKYYAEIFKSPSFISSLIYSLKISFISSFLSVLIGVLMAYCLWRNKSGSKIQNLIYKLPVVVPHTVSALLIFNLLSQTGVLSRFLYSLNIISSYQDFPILIFDSNGYGVILAYLWKGLPYAAMVTLSVFSKIPDNLGFVAKNLGATNFKTFVHIILPLILPSIASSFIILFSFSFGAFEIPYLLGASTPKALPVQAFIEFSNPDLLNRPYAMVINMILSVFSILMVVLYNLSFKKSKLLGDNNV